MSREPAGRRRIAVIGVHGVGEHLPGQTVQAIAHQLQYVCGDRYGAMDQSSLSLPVTGEDFAPAEGADKLGRWRSLQAQFGSRFQVEQKIAESNDPVDIAFTKSVVAGGKDYRSTYDTVKLSTTRKADDGADEEVTFYELYWSDLSHVGSTALALLNQLLQIVIHMASLGRTTAAVALSSIPRKSRSVWQWLYHVSTLTYWILSIPIVIGNLVLAMLAVIFIPGLLGLIDLKPIGVAMVGILVLVASGMWAFRLDPHRSGLSRLAIPPIGCLVAVLGVLAIYRAGLVPRQGECLVISGLAGLPLVWLGEILMRRYSATRPGALLVWRAMLVGTITWGVFIFLLQGPAPPAGAPREWLLVKLLGDAAIGPFYFLVVCWGALYVCNLALCLLGAIAHLSCRQADNRAALRRSVKTILLTSALPAPLFLVAVLSLWGLLFYFFQSSLPDVLFEPWLLAQTHQALSIKDYIGLLLEQSASPVFALYLALVAIAAAIAVWGMLPSIFAEVSPPKQQADRAAWRFGRWLDGGFAALGLSGVIAAFAFFVVVPYGSLIEFFPQFANQWLTDKLTRADLNGRFVLLIAPLLSGAAVGFITASKLFAGEVSSSVSKLRVIIDIALDVDNWLRERPSAATPRLKIFARFMALMKHLQRQDYEKVIIVAHSQGTVVSADFCRYLRFATKTLSADLHLFSMGSPLRQLYAWRFPALYAWVGGDPTEDRQPGPNPDDCGFKSWVNAYGSADYVGRDLWRQKNDPDRFVPDLSNPRSTHTEFCVGAAAHTHYFDEDNKIIGQCLDRLISSYRERAVEAAFSAGQGPAIRLRQERWHHPSGQGDADDQPGGMGNRAEIWHHGACDEGEGPRR
jgi:hypothetical protein